MRKSSHIKGKSCTGRKAMAAYCLARNLFLLPLCGISAGVFCIFWVEIDGTLPSSPECS